jgi:hypothetical protein
MRKILLGTTAVVSAVVGAAVMAPQASAQEAPTVRIGGFFRAYYGYTQQTSAQSQGTAAGVTSSGLPTNVAGLENVAANGNNFARLGKHDISTDAGIDVIVNGKLANGLTYGAQISLNSSGIEGRQLGGTRSSAGKTTVAVDEMYAFIAHPRFGQIRFGDEDGVMGGLMNSGWVQGFGTGGVHGSWESFVTRQAGGRTTTAPGGLGDASKIIYMSPQFAGFDFGASYAPNANVGEDVGCPNNANSGFCDRATAFTGARNFGIYAAGPEQAARRNEYQLAARWRGNVAGVGIAATVGYIGSGAALDITTGGQQFRVFNGMNIWQGGIQASYAGFTLGANYTYGDYNFFWGNTLRGDRPAEQLVVGGQYVAGPITVGANFVTGMFEGGSRGTLTENATGTAFIPGTNARPTAVNQSTNAATMRRWGMGIGANYRLAPGMDLIAEYVYYSVREQGRDLDPNRFGIQSRASSNVFLTGVRLAF